VVPAAAGCSIDQHLTGLRPINPRQLKRREALFHRSQDAPVFFAPHIPATASGCLQAFSGANRFPAPLRPSISDNGQNQKDLNPQKVIGVALPVSLKEAIVKGNKHGSNQNLRMKCEKL